MFALFFATLSSASIALLFKKSETGNFNRYRVTTANYIAALVFSLFLFILNPPDQIEWLSVLLIGIPTGLCFFGSFVLYQQSVNENGAGLSSMAAKLGILLPMLASIILWHELPSVLQGLGILLALGALIFINTNPNLNSQPKAQAQHRVGRSLIWLFLVGGLGDFASKVFQMYGHLSNKSLFLFVVFSTAFLASVYFSIKSPARVGSKIKSDFAMGLAIGIPNLLSSYFLIQALTTVPAALAFPAFSAGTVIIVTLLSSLLFKETIDRRTAIGLGITVLSLILIF